MTSVLTPRQKQVLHDLGITAWRRRDASASPPPEIQDEWSACQQAVSTCQRCPLHTTRTHTVFGVGNPQADLMIIGEAPGANEDRQGEPFVGQAGKLLDAMLAAIQWKREEVFITNILKCRPPNNRDPLPEEVAQCTAYLHEQIQLCAPKVIMALGRIAAQTLLNTTQSLGRLRGKAHSYGPLETPLVATYHPAYLLRNPAEKPKSYYDLKFVNRLVRGE